MLAPMGLGLHCLAWGTVISLPSSYLRWQSLLSWLHDAVSFFQLLNNWIGLYVRSSSCQSVQAIAMAVRSNFKAEKECALLYPPVPYTNAILCVGRSQSPSCSPVQFLADTRQVVSLSFRIGVGIIGSPHEPSPYMYSTESPQAIFNQMNSCNDTNYEVGQAA